LSGEDALRIDAWLLRARFFKTRALATKFVEAGRVRLTRKAVESRLDKASRTVRPGDDLVFAINGRIFAIHVEALGERRGPPAEARGLYRPIENNCAPAALT